MRLVASADAAQKNSTKSLGIDRDNPAGDDLASQLEKRMKGPQRHRLLQGYPAVALMQDCQPPTTGQMFPRDLSRPLIVGILPHSACNPTVAGCGYCTFPHETFTRSSVKDTVACVMSEIERDCQLDQQARPVQALYFGGGTANLTPPEDFEALCHTFNRHHQIGSGEVTLEGAPAFFVSQRAKLLDILEQAFPACALRISMGVQSFSPQWVERMGRSAIGGPEAVTKAVRLAKQRNIHTSADLLMNLPGQSLAQMIEDVKQASDLGFSQVCLYHLVLFRGLGTPWAQDRSLLNQLPDNQTAFENWQAVTQYARYLGYRQTTLTNFEREGNYRYENYSYQPSVFDATGYGPEALSTYSDGATQMAVKWMNQSDSAAYRTCIELGQSPRQKVFVYGETDLKLLHITRSLARTQMELGLYRSRFGCDLGTRPDQDFAAELHTLTEAGLLELDQQHLRLTPKGQFFSDSVTGLLSRQRYQELRNGLRLGWDDKPIIRMG